MLEPALTASRLSGVAPLAVHFDATGTAAAAGVDTFRQVSYSFNFGDDRGQAWAVSGRPKNTEVGGPIAAHVFDVPGTYTVVLQATDASGAPAQASVTISVQDPNAFYASTRTVCVSLNTDFSGCPAGAAQQSTKPTGTQWNGRRVLFKRGQDFTSLGKLDIQDGNSAVQVGAFGTGARPVVHSVGVGDWRPATANFANDVTVMDLATRGTMAQSAGHRVLFYRNDLSNPRDDQSGFYFGSAFEYWAFEDQYRSVPTSSFYNPRELFFVENTVVGSTSTNANAFGLGARMAWLGNDMGTTRYHNLRITRGFKTIVAHNRLRGVSSDGIRHSLKFHAGGLNPYADSATVSGRAWASRFNVISSNEGGSVSDNNQWIFAVDPQNDVSTEGLEDVIVENNRFIRGPRSVQDIVLGGRRLTHINNATTSGQAARIATNVNLSQLPADWRGPYNASR